MWFKNCSKYVVLLVGANWIQLPGLIIIFLVVGGVYRFHSIAILGTAVSFLRFPHFAVIVFLVVVHYCFVVAMHFHEEPFH